MDKAKKARETFMSRFKTEEERTNYFTTLANKSAAARNNKYQIRKEKIARLVKVEEALDLAYKYLVKCRDAFEDLAVEEDLNRVQMRALRNRDVLNSMIPKEYLNKENTNEEDDRIISDYLDFVASRVKGETEEEK